MQIVVSACCATSNSCHVSGGGGAVERGRECNEAAWRGHVEMRRGHRHRRDGEHAIGCHVGVVTMDRGYGSAQGQV